MKKKWNKVMAFLLAVIIAFGDCGYCFATELREGIEENVTIEEEMESVTESDAFDAPVDEAVTEQTEIVTDTEKAMEATQKTETADNGVSENTMEEEVYYGDQSMEEMVVILQAGREPKEFFKYSIWTFLTVEDMVYLNRQGYTLDDMFSFLMEEADANDPVIEEMLLRFYSMDCESMTPQTYALEAESISTYAASATVTFGGDISTSALGVISAFGSKSHGTMKSIYLNGQTAFCAKYGAACSTGMTYTATSHTALGISDGQYALLKRIFSWYMKAQSINDNTLNTAITQAAFWLVLNNTWTGNAAGMASAISPLFSKTILTQSISENLFEAMVGWVNNPAEVANYDLIFWANGVNQYLVTCYYNPPAPTEYSAHVKITKTDAVNGLPVYGNATFHIYNADGTDTGATFTKNGNEYVSSTIVTTNAGSSYYVVETSSPTGYLEHGTRYPFTIEAGDSDAEKIIANSGNVFVNTPSSAYVRLTKTDEYSGAGITSPAIFKIYDQDGNDTGATFTQNGNVYTSSTLYCRSEKNTYYVVETSSPAGYLANGNRYAFTIEKNDNNAEKIITTNGSSFTNTPSSAYVRLTKTDEYSGAGITSPATFKIYDQDGNDTGATFTQNGNVYTSSLIYCRGEKNTYYVVETSSPAGYIPNDNRYSFTIQNSDYHAEKVITSNGRSFTNRPSSAYVKIVKTDAITNGSIQGKAAFKILDADGNDTGATFTKNGNTYTSSVIYCRSNKNTYYVVEESAPRGYVTDTKRYSFTIANTDDKALKNISNNTRGTFDNMPYLVRLSIPKVDAETKNKIVNNAVFTVHATKGNLSKPVTFTKQDDGSYLSNEIYYNETNFGAFYVTETKAPEKYYGDFANENANKTAGSDQNKTVYAFTVSGANTGQTLKITNDVSMFCNTPVKGTLSIVKQDRERGTNIAQGDATLEGAVYGLYAAEDILLPDGSKVIHTDGSLVAKLVTDENGKASVDNLYLGRYVVKEMEPSKGYTLDTTAYPINILYKDETVLEIAASQTVTEQVIKQPFQLIKVGGSEDMTEVDLLSAGFQIYLVSSLEKVKDGSIKPDANGDYDVKQFLTYDFSKEETAMDYSKKPEGEPIPELFTDETGYLKSPELAYGTYVVIESTTPENYETIAPFLVKITKDSRQPQAWRVFYDKEFEAKVKVNKKDIHSSENVLKAGTEYLLYDVNNKKYVTQWVSYPTKVLYGTKEQPYTTDAEGFLITPESIQMGDYLLEEVKAPDAYIKTGYEGYSKDGEVVATPKENIRIHIDSNMAYYVDEDTEDVVIVANQYNEAAKGTLRLYKSGEYLIGTVKNENTDFLYEEAPIEGACFSVYAKEAIYSSDGQGTLLYEADALVAELTTDENGYALLENIPLGTYYVKETYSGGKWALNTEVKEFTLSYADDETPVVFADVHFFNERQKIEVSISKKDAEDETPLSGAEFTLYSADFLTDCDDDITVSENDMGTYAIGSAVALVLSKDEPIETVVTNSEGYAKFQADLPNGYYFIKETKAPDGYVVNNDVFIVDASYQDPLKTSLSFHYDATNEKIKGAIAVKKKDGVDGSFVQRAKLGLYKTDGELVKEFYTSVDAYYINNLELGDYVLKELETPKGYVKAEDIEFCLNTETEVIEIEMTDERPEAQLNVLKVDQATGNTLAGAVFCITRKDTEEVMDIITTSENGIATSRKLPIADYQHGEMGEPIVYLVTETKAPEGYTIDFEETELTFAYEDETTILYVEWLTAKDEKIPDTPDKPKLPQTGDDFPTWLFYSIGIFGIFIGLFILLKKRKLGYYLDADEKELLIRNSIVSICIIVGLLLFGVPVSMQMKGAHERKQMIEALEAVPKNTETGVSENDVSLKIDGILGTIEIESLDISYPIVEGTDDASLRYAVGHYIGSADIGAVGNCVLAGHRGGRYGTLFKYLTNINEGDIVTVTDDTGTSFDYKVAETYVTKADDMMVVFDRDDELTLITCENHGKQRFIVKCKRV